MLQSARQDPFVQLVKVNKLDQVREFGVPVVKAEEGLPVILALERHKKTCQVRGHSSGTEQAPKSGLVLSTRSEALRDTHGAGEVS